MASSSYDENRFSAESVTEEEIIKGGEGVSTEAVEKILVKKGICTPEEISTESMVNILIQKGICTADEISEMEGTIRKSKSFKQVKSDGNSNSANFIKIKNPYDRGKLPGLKRYLSNYRWTRKLGTKLFGWKWKKVKNI